MFGWRWETDNSELSLTGRHQRLPKPGRHAKVFKDYRLASVGVTDSRPAVRARSGVSSFHEPIRGTGGNPRPLTYPP